MRAFFHYFDAVSPGTKINALFKDVGMKELLSLRVITLLNNILYYHVIMRAVHIVPFTFPTIRNHL